MADPEESLSPIEEVYDRNVAAEKLKQGTKYEQLTALVFQSLDRNSEITHDVRLRGDGKTTVHQIDVRIVRNGGAERVIIECRDKADPNKIDLDEARSFATVVRQLAATGVMVTTTDFTAGAKTLADDEGIALMTLRPFIEADKDGRIETIIITMRFVMPTPDTIEVMAPTSEGSDFDAGNIAVSVETVIVSGDASGTVRELLASLMEAPLYGPVPEGPQSVAREFDPVLILDIEGKRLEVGEIRVGYHIEVGEETIRVDAGDRVAELILRSLDGTVDKVIWNQDLQRYVVDSVTGIVRDRRDEPGGTSSGTVSSE